MGKWIDRAVLTSLAAAAFYLLFLSAFGSIIPAACMAFMCCALLIHVRRGRPGRMTKRQAQTILEHWAYGPDDQARAQIELLIGTGKPGEELVYLPKHPSATLSMTDAFSAWKSHRSAKKLILASVCYADGRARTFARTLQEPYVAILDAARLIPLIRKSSIPVPHSPGRRRLAAKLRLTLSELPSRRPWYKSLAAGTGLMLVYLLSGNAAYLALATAMLFLAGISIRSRA